MYVVARHQRRDAARISGASLPSQQKTQAGLTHLYGIGREKAKGICQNCEGKQSSLTPADMEKIRKAAKES